MIKNQTSLIWPGCAQGKYLVKANGFIPAILRWGNGEESFRHFMILNGHCSNTAAIQARGSRLY